MNATWIIDREITDEDSTPVWIPVETWPGTFGGTAAANRATELAAHHGVRFRVRLVTETVTFTAK